ncbi:MAG: DHHW family protein [Faecousia sp.]
MKTKKSDCLTVFLFCGFLAAMALGYLLLPKKEFSETEKRYLAQAPALNWEDAVSGEWGDGAETYLADHIPGRNFFVGLNAYFELLTGRQVSKEIWVAEDRLVEAPVDKNDTAVQRNMAAVNGFADSLGRTVDLMIVPSTGWAAGLAEYQDDGILDGIYAQAGQNLHPVDVRSVFAGRPELFYKTDHHWNSEGAYAGYQAYMTAIGRECRSGDDFEKAVYAGFQGSTYSRSALWLTRAEDLELWRGSENLTVTNSEQQGTHAGVFYWERLEEADKYTVFLDGNHSLVRIQNPEAEGKLLVIRDSFSNSLGCFLAESYGEVVLVDLRYYKQPVSELAEQEDFDDILVCYSIGNFLTDANIVWLR